MAEDAIAERGKELEEAFFRKLNAQLVQKLNAEHSKAADKEALSALTGITDSAVLDKLIALNISPSTLAAFTLLPLVQVAWADGSVTAKEAKATLDAAKSAGLSASALELVEGWLKQAPSAAMFSTWKAYIAELSKHLNETGRASLKNDVLARSRGVAEASGGILGMGKKVSREEAAMLKQIEDAFNG